MLRSMGATVKYIDGAGISDLLVGYDGRTYLMEVKNTEGRNRFTPAQIEFHAKWRGGPLLIIRTPEEAVKAVTNC